MSRLFVGSAICSIGQSGNLILPKDFYITIICRKASNSLYVCLHEYLNCLVIVDEVHVRDVFARFERQRAQEGGVATMEQLDSLRRNFGLSAATKVDSKGHIAIAPALNEWRGEARQALIVGIGHGFEVWDLDFVLDHGRPDLRLIASFHLKARNAQNAKGNRREPPLHAVRPYRANGAARKPGLPIQPVHALLPRHHPIFDAGGL